MGRPSDFTRTYSIAVYCHALERRYGGGLERAMQETMTKFNVGTRRSLRPASGGLVDAF